MFTQPTQIPRSPFASTLTVVFHGALLLLVLVVSAIPNIPKITPKESITFVSAAALPELELPKPPAPEPPPAPRLEPPPEPPKPVETPVIEKPPAPEPPKVERKIPEQPKEIPPVPKPPQVVVGAFSEASAASRKPDPKPEVAVVGFDAAEAQAGRTRREVAVVEGFETNLPTTNKPTRGTLVAEAGFGVTTPGAERKVARATGAAGFSTDDAPRPAAQQQPRTTSAAGFSSDPTPRPAPAAAPKPAQTATFADTPPPPKPVAAPKPAPKADRPVEVLYKPTPSYTEEARTKGIEGEVALEVNFTADGQVQVLRVVRGLGHGLDEMARRAAEQIRFRPATSNGTPVDFRANLTIVFRLT
ncbi:MAG TPA: energy transducer TonB [Vicinamibacterales bacterium]|nr:energy transducer TonB [Vicinamibacterales bacterium]